MGREFELKYAADPETLASIGAKFPGLASIVMETSYYDTPAGDLAARKWTLRRRLENGRAVCTLKTLLRDGSRGEWETEGLCILDAIPELCKLGGPQELLSLTAEGVTEVCAARFTRQARLRRLPGCTLELALDQGVFLGGGREAPFWEVEVELKEGSEIVAVAFAKALAAEFGLKEQPLSKAQRALALASTAHSLPVPEIHP